MRTRVWLSTLLATAIGTSASAQTAVTEWTIDPNHTAVQFAVRHLLVSTVRGQFEKMSGTISYDGSDVRTIAVEVTIDAASVNTRVAMRDNDLRSANFFEVDKYPTIRFVSKRAERVDDGHVRLTGDLTIRGITREVALEVEGPVPPVKQGPVLRTGATASVKIKRQDFGLQYNRVIEGAAIVGDDISITIDIEAVRREP